MMSLSLSIKLGALLSTCIAAYAAGVAFAWDPGSSQPTGTRLYYGMITNGPHGSATNSSESGLMSWTYEGPPQGGSFTNMIDCGTNMTATVSNLTDNVLYAAYVVAYWLHSPLVESEPSNVVEWKTPLLPIPNTPSDLTILPWHAITQ